MGVQVFTTGYRIMTSDTLRGALVAKSSCHSTIPYTGDLEVGVTVLGYVFVSMFWVYSIWVRVTGSLGEGDT